MTTRDPKLKEVEKLLQGHEVRKESIISLRETIREIEQEEATIGAVDYGKERTAPTFKVNSETEEKVIKKQEIIAQLKRQIAKAECQVKKIERALGILNEKERLVIEYKYIKGLEYFKFTHLVDRSERTCKYIRKKALKKMRVALFGEPEKEKET